MNRVTRFSNCQLNSLPNLLKLCNKHSRYKFQETFRLVFCHFSLTFDWSSSNWPIMNHKLLAPYNKIVFEQSLLKTPYTCGFWILAFLASVLSGNPGLKNQLLQLHSQQLWIAEREWRVRASKKFAISVATIFWQFLATFWMFPLKISKSKMAVASKRCISDPL